jgi:nitrite reductase/ring-hydroxylating ferredoxin subunit
MPRDADHHVPPLCRLADLADPGTRGFRAWREGVPVEIFLVRQGDRVFAYCNSCPHTGGPLDWVPDQFLDADQALIQCATHAALFRIEDGHCIAGPCTGQSLTAVPVVVRGGEVFLAPPWRPAADD